MASFHASTYGQFGRLLPVDVDGYCHTTISGWMVAPMDWAGDRLNREQMRDWARGRAADSREAIRKADSALGGWRGVSQLSVHT